MAMQLSPWPALARPSGNGSTVRAAQADFSVYPDGGSTRLSCRGELDLAEAPRLDAILAVLEWQEVPVNVALGDVTFADSSGVRPLVDAAHRRADLNLPPLRLEGASRPVCRVFGLLGIALQEVFDPAGLA